MEKNNNNSNNTNSIENIIELKNIVKTYDNGFTAVDGFNLEVDGYERFNDAYLMEFSAVDDSEICTRLFGFPSDWNYVDEPPRLLLQYDPLDNDMDFLDMLDGFVYFFFGDDARDFGAVELREEYS